MGLNCEQCAHLYQDHGCLGEDRGNMDQAEARGGTSTVMVMLDFQVTTPLGVYLHLLPQYNYQQ